MPDVELRKGHLDAQGREASEDGHQAAAAGGPRSDDEVALESYAINVSPCVLDDADNLEGGVCLGIVVLKAVVIVVAGAEEQLRVSRDQCSICL
jgi:hypothetical protein